MQVLPALGYCDGDMWTYYTNVIFEADYDS